VKIAYRKDNANNFWEAVGQPGFRDFCDDGFRKAYHVPRAHTRAWIDVHWEEGCRSPQSCVVIRPHQVGGLWTCDDDYVRSIVGVHEPLSSYINFRAYLYPSLIWHLDVETAP